MRGGKSYSATVEFVKRIFEDIAAGKGRKTGGVGRRRAPRLLYWIVSPTMDLSKIPYRYLQELVPPQMIENQSQSDYSIWLRGDVLIEVKSAERPQTLVAAAVNGMLIDEACRVKPEAWKGSLRGRLTDTRGWALFATSPMGGRSSWVYQELVAKEDPQIDPISWTTSDNPWIYRSEIEDARRQLPPAWFARDYEASWDSFGGAIYSEFSPAHVVSEAQFRLEFGLGSRHPSDWKLFRRVIIGVDWGFSSPGAMVVIGHFGEDRYVILEESYAANRPILGTGTTWLSEARRLKDKWAASMFVCDPARPDAINDFITNGINAIPGFNDIYLGIRRVSEGIHPRDGVPGMLVFDTCQHLLAEVRSYQWKQNKEVGTFAETPADGQADHACDALRYGVTELRPFSKQGSPSMPASYSRGARPIG